VKISDQPLMRANRSRVNRNVVFYERVGSEVSNT
jgi:hypothetical protein